jgi:hypothetical protein
MSSESIQRVSSLWLANQQAKEASVREWVKWMAQPFEVIWKHHRKFVSGPIDDAVDKIIKDLAPKLVHTLLENTVESDLRAFEQGALEGKELFDSNDPRPKISDKDPKNAGILWGWDNADSFQRTLPPKIRKERIETEVRRYRSRITEEVVSKMLRSAWDAVNPKHTINAIKKAVKKHGWKLGVGFALFEIFEHFALPALMMKLTGDPKMLALASLPIGEVIYAVIFRILGRTPKNLDQFEEDGHLDWYENNYGEIRLASTNFPPYEKWAAILAASETVDMVAAVKGGNQFVGARDAIRREFHSPGFWSFIDPEPVKLYYLNRVPLDLAERAADYNVKNKTFASPQKAWNLLKKYARPFR